MSYAYFRTYSRRNDPHIRCKITSSHGRGLWQRERAWLVLVLVLASSLPYLRRLQVWVYPLVMLNYAVYANLCLRGAKMLLNLRNYAIYALCSDSAIMPKSNAGIIGLAQQHGLVRWEGDTLKGQSFDWGLDA